MRYNSGTLLLALHFIGLALFAVTERRRCLPSTSNPFMAILMGGIMGVGGGAVRDMLLAQIPAVLRADVYAVAALAGATVMIAGLRMGGPPTPMTIIGAVVCFLLRMVAVWQHRNLPRANQILGEWDVCISRLTVCAEASTRIPSARCCGCFATIWI